MSDDLPIVIERILFGTLAWRYCQMLQHIVSNILNSGHAKPHQKLKRFQILCYDGYGSMLWDLRGNPAEQYFIIGDSIHPTTQKWNTCMKLFASLRNQILSRSHPGFNSNLVTSPSKGVRVRARMVGADPRSTTYTNLRYLREVMEKENAEWYST